MKRHLHVGNTCEQCDVRSKKLTDNPLKVGDKVQYMDRSNASVHTILAMDGEFLWLDDDNRVPYTARAGFYIKAEEPIVAGQRWRRVGDSYYAVIVEVTDNHVIYTVYTWINRVFARTHADFRKEYTR